MKSLGYGLGLRAKHYDYVIQNKPKVDWFEVISENYMNTRGRPRVALDKIRADYPIVMHGVSMSIGSSDPLDMSYLQRLKDLAAEIEPAWISDHLCWTGIQKKNTHDLLPVPLTEETLAHVVERIKRVQDFMGRHVLLENPSSYLTYRADEIPEYEFMARMAEEADCALLLDANNIYVASFNQRLDPYEYINAIPMDRVVQVHLAGHMNKGTHIVDTHDGPVIQDVWDLYKYITRREGFAASTMVEWDDKIPEFPVLEAEIAKAREFAGAEVSQSAIANAKQRSRSASNHGMRELHEHLQGAIFSGDVADAATWIEPKEGFAPEAQLGVYVEGYRLRLRQIIVGDYEVTAHYFGKEKMRELVAEYVETVRSQDYDVGAYSAQFTDWLRKQDVADFGKELARLEKTVFACFDMEEKPALKVADMGGLVAEDFASMKFKPRAASVLAKFDADVNGYMTNFYAGEKCEESSGEVFVMAYAHGGKVYRVALRPQEFQMLELMRDGREIGDVMEVVAANSEMDETALAAEMQSWFSMWLGNDLLDADLSKPAL